MYLLFEYGSDVQSKTSRKETALHLAVRKHHEPAVRVLLGHRIDIRAKDGQGRTALHTVAEGGDCCDPTYEERTSEELVANNLEIAKLLLENGTDMETKDGKGKTPVDLAEAKEENAMNELFHKQSCKHAQY